MAPVRARILELAGWAVAASVGALMLTQGLGLELARPVAVAQSLTPYAVVPTAVVAIVAALGRRALLALVAGSIGASMLWLAAPLAFPPDRPATTGEPLRIASVNLLYTNDDVVAAADVLADLDLDVVAFHEYTDEHARLLRCHRLARLLPHRTDPGGAATGGMAIWSRLPFTDPAQRTAGGRTVDRVVEGPNGPVRVLAVHPITPIQSFERWREALDRIAERATGSPDPIVVVGDFNATWWHPAFRDLLADADLADAHVTLGRGWSTSWPTDRSLPPFVRLDHALTDDRLAATAVEDVRIPGSDHEAVVVTVRPVAAGT